MVNIGVTGHQRMPDEAVAHAAGAIKEVLARLPKPVVGYTSLAAGSDQLFAQLVLAAGGSIVAIIPSGGYESTFSAEGLAVYRDLLEQASDQVVLGFNEPTEAAFMAAGEEVIRRSDLVIAVWDGQPQPPGTSGGTSDAVWYAWSLGKPVINAWPKGVPR
jgi:hypothetical protein